MSLKVIGWDSPGVKLKPQHCRLCPLSAVGQGFCEDEAPASPKIALIFDMPQRADVTNRAPLSGGEGRHWQKIFIEDNGFLRSDVLLSTCLRCAQPNDKMGQAMYPREPLRRQAEMNCRHYDTKLLKFDPNLFILSEHPRNIRRVGCYQRQIARDVAKAFHFAAQGYRPAVLLGEGICELFYPWIRNAGGLKNWRGHWWVGESPFKEGLAPIKPRLFAEG